MASADLCVWFGSVRFRPEQICAVTDSVSEQQRSVCSISNYYYEELNPVQSQFVPAFH